MDFTVTAPSGTRKTIALSFTADDVAAAIDKDVAERRRNLVLPGFRKGKVPAGIIEKRFGEEIMPAATQKALDDALAVALQKEKLFPLSAVDLDNPSGLFKRGSDYACTMSFDVLPDIDFPAYTGLAVEQPKVTFEDKETDELIARLREDIVDLKPLAIARLPQDGDLADVSYTGYNENHEPIPGVDGKFNVVLGKGQTLPDFETLVKSVLPGEEKEGPVAFPADYQQKDLAGKTITMKVKVNDLKERKELPLDDEFAKKAGSENMEKLREAIKEHLISNKRQTARGIAMRKLLDGLLEKAPAFDVPAGLVESRLRRASAEYFSAMQKEGQAPDEKAVKDFRDNSRPAIERELRPQVFLMALARKEGLDVTNEEVEMQIYSMAARAGQDYRHMSEAYRRAGMTNEIYDRLLADKAMNFIYDKAEITEIEAAAAAQEDAAPAAAPEETANS